MSKRAPYRYADRRIRPLGCDAYGYRGQRKDPRYAVLASVLGDSLLDWLNAVWWPTQTFEQAHASIDALMTIITLSRPVPEADGISGAAVEASLSRVRYSCCAWLIANELEGLTCYRRGTGHRRAS